LYLNLKPAGKYYKALCPFHTEKTPSFFVMPEKNNYVCYGCNRFGDIFTLVQEMENISFPEAINFLIEKFHIPVERTEFKKPVKKDEFLKINETAKDYFIDNLHNREEGKKALYYLKKRSINPNSIKNFSLGYAENSWDGLLNFLTRKGCNIEKAIELGLLIRSGKNRVYDRFRGRIIFPIFSETGNVLAFGGRTMFDDPTKYLNSPDSPVYKKSKHLYGFNLAKQYIRENNQVILVEGYFDMISLYQNGIGNVAASLGTALTESQINLLRRFSDKIFMFYDMDKAGTEATIRGIEKMFEQNTIPHIVNAGKSKDPDDFIREYGIEAFHSVLDSSVSGFKFLLEKIRKDYDFKIPERKSAALEQVRNFLKKMADPIIQDEYRVMAADFFMVDPKLINLKERISNSVKDEIHPLVINPAEKEFLESLIAAPEFISEIKGLFNEEILSILVSRNIIKSIFKNYDEKTQVIDYQQIGHEINDAEKARFNRLFFSLKNSEENRRALAEKIEASFLSFQNILNNKKIADINREIRVADREGDLEKVKKLMILKDQFIRKKRKQCVGGTLERNQG
jgi:DNA primase